MQECIKAVHFERKSGADAGKGGGLSDAKVFGLENAKKVNDFHKSFKEYEPTPLASLNNFAKANGLSSLYVKDESYRFGLNAFKVLGGSYCIGSYIAQRLGLDISELPYDRMVSKEIKDKLGDLTFVTATDGNHGRGIAWTANRLGMHSVVLMPKGSSEERLHNIQALGSDASITELNYDDAVRKANSMAETQGWVMVQDTAWEGYEEIPTWIMQGYTTMAYEALMQLGVLGADGKLAGGVSGGIASNGAKNKPTHIFLQAGVGAMSGGLTGFFADVFGDENRPIITIVEPNKADCIYRTAYANDGKLHFVKGDMTSICAGLCCGEPCTIGWEMLKGHADNFLSVPDYVAAKGMRLLGNPLKGDDKVVSGESGAITAGVVAEIMQNPSLGYLRDQLKLDENSRVLCFSTEGDTDRENYRKIVWDGLYPSF